MTATISDLPPPLFTTPRLTIRPLHPQDAPTLSAAANNPAVSKYMTLAFPSPYPLSAAEYWINLNQTPPLYNWAITLSSDPGTVIGGCGLKPGVDIQAHGAEVGYWIGDAYWGRGIVSECLEGLTEWVFTEEGRRWTRLWGAVIAGNGASVRCFEKCGFVHEGVLRGAVVKEGVANDLVVLGLLKGEWEERRRGGGE